MSDQRIGTCTVYRTVRHPAARALAPSTRPRAPSYGAAVAPWDDGEPGVVVLPSGRRVRGRGLRRPLPAGRSPRSACTCWVVRRASSAESRWVRWPDLRLPADPVALRAALTEAWERLAAERVEVACGGGRGRTGTALALLAVLDGVPAEQAVAFVRRHYDARAVETPWQRRYVHRRGRGLA